jgi:hypothetical protein
MKLRLPAVAVLGCAAVLLPFAAPASAATVSRPLASQLIGPLGLAVAPNGTAYVAESFRGALTTVSPTGVKRQLAAIEGGEIAGVHVDHTGDVAIVSTVENEDESVTTRLQRVGANGALQTLADLGKYEEQHNPDGGVSYGLQNLAANCNAQVPQMFREYKGIVESHPYAVTRGGTRTIWRDRRYYVADAAANAILEVNGSNQIRTIAVLPPRPVVVTAAVRTALNEQLAAEAADQGDPNPPQLPECVVGSTANFESVPTDVEVGPFGVLYVSTLPGGPEHPSIGGGGSVYTVNPFTQRVKLLATGFPGAVTNLAVSPTGTVYVAELFGGAITAISKSGARTLVTNLVLPATVEWHGGRLYATTEVFGPDEDTPPNGKLVVITP